MAGAGAAVFGAGTLDSPRIKFYFSSPCPAAGVTAGQRLPQRGVRPAFRLKGKELVCDICQVGKTFNF